MRDDPAIQLIKPLDLITERTIRSVCEAANALGIDVLLCGATARVLVLEHIYGLEPDRKTNDVDFAFAVHDWPQHEQLVQRLIDTGSWLRGKKGHDLLPITDMLPIDLVPYGQIANKQGNIHWPPRRAFEMSVLGLAEANSHALRVAVAHDLQISIVDIISTAMLKLIAWRDRRLDPDARRRHAQDFASILKNYGEFKFNEERLYADAPDIFARADGDVRFVGAWLLGQDVGRRAAGLTRDRLRKVFDAKDSLLLDIQATAFRDSSDDPSIFLSYFVEGFEFTVAN